MKLISRTSKSTAPLISRQTRADIAWYAGSLVTGLVWLPASLWHFGGLPWLGDVLRNAMFFVVIALGDTLNKDGQLYRRAPRLFALSLLPATSFAAWQHPERAPLLVAILFVGYYLAANLLPIAQFFRRLRGGIGRSA